MPPPSISKNYMVGERILIINKDCKYYNTKDIIVDIFSNDTAYLFETGYIVDGWDIDKLPKQRLI